MSYNLLKSLVTFKTIQYHVGVNVKGEYRLWSPGSQQQCFGTHPSVIGTYKYITLYMMILFIN